MLFSRKIQDIEICWPAQLGRLDPETIDGSRKKRKNKETIESEIKGTRRGAEEPQDTAIIYEKDQRYYLINPRNTEYNYDEGTTYYVVTTKQFKDWLEKNLIAPVIPDSPKTNFLYLIFLMAPVPFLFQLFSGWPFLGILLGVTIASSLSFYLLNKRDFNNYYHKKTLTPFEQQSLHTHALQQILISTAPILTWTLMTFVLQMALSGILLSPHGQFFHIMIALLSSIVMTDVAIMCHVYRDKKQGIQHSWKHYAWMALAYFSLGAMLYFTTALPFCMPASSGSFHMLPIFFSENLGLHNMSTVIITAFGSMMAAGIPFLPAALTKQKKAILHEEFAARRFEYHGFWEQPDSPHAESDDSDSEMRPTLVL